MPRSASARSIWLKRSSTKVSRGSGTSDRSGLDRIGVAIEANHSSRPRSEHGTRVAACSESAVDHRFAAVKRERRNDFVDQHRHVWGLACAGAGHDCASLFEAEAGDVLEVVGNALVVEQQLRVPDLEGFAGAEEQRELADLALAAHHRREEDPAGAVVGHLFGRGEGHQVALLIFELRVGAGLFLLEQPLELGVLQRRVGGVVGAEAGKGFVLGEDDGAGIAAALDDAAQERREWTRGPSRRPRSARCPETDALAPRPLPVRSARAIRSRTRVVTRAPRPGFELRVSPRATAYVGNSTASRDTMGFYGI